MADEDDASYLDGKIAAKAVETLPAAAAVDADVRHLRLGALADRPARRQRRGRVHRDSWALPPVFEWLQAGGNIEELEMMRTFNCGVGMILVVAAEHTAETLRQLDALGLSSWALGEISDDAVGVTFC